MKRLVSLFIVFAISICLPLSAHASETPKIELSADRTEVKSGDTFNVTITVDQEISGTVLEIKPAYDSSVFELVSGSGEISGADSVEFDPANGFRFSFDQGVIPAGKVGTFRLKVKASAASGNYQISTKATVDGAECQVVDIRISVSCTHSYGQWSKADEYTHAKTCSVCGDVQSENHTLTNTVITKNPNCLEGGTQTAECSICGGSLTQTIGKTDNHQFGSWTDNGDGAHRRTCGICEAEETAQHQWDAGTVIKESTCAEAGEIRFSCTDCGAVKTETSEKSSSHDYGEWTQKNDEEHERFCRICGDASETQAHQWDEGTVIVQPTCKDEGVMHRKCTVCNATVTEPVEKLTTHRYSNDCDEVCNICDETREGKHTYSKAWSMDQINHWHQCTKCADKTDIGVHQPGAAATETTPQICWLCEYVIKPALGHEHDYAEELTIDETGHWYACSGCEEKKDYEEHVLYSKCDQDCAVCSYTRQTEHQFSMSLSSDATGHWYACTSCGEQSEFEAHTPGAEANEFEAQLCTVCGFEIVPALGHTHVYSEAWMIDQMHHWRQCFCGEKAEKDYHIWVNGVENDDGTVTYTCLDCQAQTVTGTPQSGGVWWILPILVIGGGAAAFWILKRKSLFAKK